MRLVGLSDGTQRVYLDAVRHSARRCHRSPDELTQEQVREYFLELSRCGLPPSTVRVYLFALKFLCLNTLQRDWSLLKLYRIKKTKRLSHPDALGGRGAAEVGLGPSPCRRTDRYAGRAAHLDPHVHCLVPGGGLGADGRWVPARKDYLVPVRALSRLFRGIFMQRAKRVLPDQIWATGLWKQDWVVYAKPAHSASLPMLEHSRLPRPRGASTSPAASVLTQRPIR